jgi:uncharacterized protein (TIGR03437 family)
VSVRRGLYFPLALVLFLAPGLLAQPSAGSITTHGLPFSASSTFIDAAGNVYATGSSNGNGVTPGAAQTQPGGGTCLRSLGMGPEVPVPCPDAYIAKADANGNLVFGTLLGGDTSDAGTALAVDAAGEVFVAGNTGGPFPTTANAAISTSTTSTTFAAKLSADGSRFIYVTYLPSTAQTALSIAVDSQGNAYVAGQTQTGHAYITKLNPAGSAFLYSVTLAGSQNEMAVAARLDAAGNLLVAGWTNSPDFPVSSGVVQPYLAGAPNIFVTKLSPIGRFLFSTYLGGSGLDIPSAIQTDSAGNIYVTGITTSLDFPTTSGVFQTAPIVPLWNTGSPGGFIASLSPDASAIRYASYVMSVDNPNYGSVQGATSLAVTAAGEAYVAGTTGAGFPVTQSAPQICFHGPLDAFVAHLDAQGALVEATYAGGGDQEAPQALAVESGGSILLQAYSPSSVPNNTVARIQFGGSGFAAPACLSPSPANAATLFSDGSLAPGEFLSLTGFGIGPDTGVAYTPAGAQWQAPLQLAGVVVSFDGQAAPLLYVQSRQVNVLAPFELSGKASTTIQVQYNGSLVGSMTVPVNGAAPGIFRSQEGVSSQAAAANQDGTVNSPSNPAAPGSYVSVWGTGFGSIDPPCATGGLNPFAAVSLNSNVTISAYGALIGETVSAEYAGSAPGMACGVEQINFQVPSSAHGSTYLYPLVTFGSELSGYSSFPGATIAVQ